MSAQKPTAPLQKPWKRSLIGLCIVMCAAMLTACAVSTKHSPELPPSLTKPCPRLTPLDSMTGAAMTRKIIEISKQYYDCADSKESLIKAVK